MWTPLIWSLLACSPTTDMELGEFTVTLHRKEGTFDVRHFSGTGLDDVRLLAGKGSAEVEMAFGAFRFDDVVLDLTQSAQFKRPKGRNGPLQIVEVLDGKDQSLGIVSFSAIGRTLLIDWSPDGRVNSNRGGFSAACDADDHFMGLGAHAQDVDHVGESFFLWTQEPGIGKSDSESLPVNWPLGGTKHATSFPVPFLLRPQHGQGILLDTTGRVDVDLCASKDRFEMVAWHEGATRIRVIAGGTPTAAIQELTANTGRPALPPPWVFGPWNDAIKGADRVNAVADRLREFGAPSTAIWTEDWKGGEDNPATGYHLTGEWTVDEELYPAAEEMAIDLEDRGFKWFAYFSPFVFEETSVWDDAVAHDVLVKNPDGEPYLFQSALIGTQTGWVDLSTNAGRDWVGGYLQGAIDIGFDGWMADFAEWLPPDAVLASGESALEAHNAYPEWWQETNRNAIGDQDVAFFVRSGWIRTGGLVPAVWAGDQRTSFDADDGMPSVLSMGLGLAASGVPIFTHDVAGYQSVGNDPTTKELWFRWASLGAYTPISRTHHGAYDEENWQFDSDDETTEHQARVASENMRLWPYRYGLAARAADHGIPMIQPVSFVVDNEDWSRQDAWMLGDALLIAPVLEAGVTSRDVELPASEDWWNWHTLEPAISGSFPTPLGEIPVFARANTLVPTFDAIPDTLVETKNPDIVTLEDVDHRRILYVFGDGATFVEGDGTRYKPSGSATGSGEATATLRAGEIEAAGVRVKITGTTERTYTLIVVAD